MAEAWESQVATKLPDNAYRELKPGETYTPMVPAHVKAPEITLRSFIIGIVMNVIFSVVATFVALKAGQGIETAIPISILTVGLSSILVRMGSRRSSIIENVNVLAISTTSGIVAGGTCFTMPAIYILELDKTLQLGSAEIFLLVFLVPFLGAILGVLFLIPFRRYFVKDMHGKLPFPEGTATNEILAAGVSSSSKQAMILLGSFAIAMVYNFFAGALKLFTGAFTTGMLAIQNGTGEVLAIHHQVFATLTEKFKAVFTMGTGAYYLGLGFILGVRYAAIICAGSFLSCFVIVPMLSPFGLENLKTLNPTISSVTPEAIWKAIPRSIGIGGIFAAGLISIISMSKVIITALRQALGGLFASKAGGGTERTDRDINYSQIMIIGILVTLALALYFRFAVFSSLPNATYLTIVSVILALVIAFLFTTVSAWAIAMISTTPISGMTATTIIITAVIMLAAGLEKGPTGMMAVLLVGSVVCTALSMAGTLVTEFKLGYWLGSTPSKIQWSAMIASVLASVIVAGTIIFLADSNGYVKGPDHPNALSAPQATTIASAIDAFLNKGGSVPWLLYGTGAVISIILKMLNVSPLAFALGMYLPMEINTPILIGAFIAHFINKSTSDEKLARARASKGILVASGLIAGGAIIDVIWAVIVELQPGAAKALNIGARIVSSGTDASNWTIAHNWFGLAAFLALCLYVYWDCCRAKVEEGAPEIHM
ncbi:MAG: hypothetical protein HJJLKODD_00287 [Phycisphaerae bacterium]|nr:hypothetical protein [Phycisphaerae bacterium]